MVITVDGVRIGFVATDSIGETPAAGRSPGTNRINAPPRTGPFDAAALDRVAESVRELDADVVIAVTHWGTQYTNVPERSQRRIARALADAGVDVVAGGHPHWVQGWEAMGDATAVHSLGNFVFDMDFMRETNEGIFLEIVSRGDRVVAVEPVPYVIDSRFTPRLVWGARANQIFERIRETSSRRSTRFVRESARTLQPGGHDRAHPAQLTAIDDPWKVAGRVIGSEREAADPCGRQIVPLERPVVAGAVVGTEAGRDVDVAGQG